jgi:flagellar basal-body rod modification protein FlgD
MAVTATSATDSTSSLNALTANTTSSADSEQRFLKLLVTQLNNQDPTNPLDNAQLTSQLAQMSTVSGIEKLNGAFQSLISQSGSSQVLQSAALVGRIVLVPGSDIELKQGASAPFAVDMPGAADSVKVTVTNAAGDTVRTIDLGALAPGVKTMSWDGLGDNGAAVADGSYTFTVAATAAGTRLAASALTYENVVSVSQGASGVALDLGSSRKANLSDVRQIL